MKKMDLDEIIDKVEQTVTDAQDIANFAGDLSKGDFSLDKLKDVGAAADRLSKMNMDDLKAQAPSKEQLAIMAREKALKEGQK